MANRRLNNTELDLANKLLEEIRGRIQAVCRGDDELHWALRRKIYKELTYDERGKPALRRKLKDGKWKAQRGLCDVCHGELPDKGTILDRYHAMKGYTEENTRLICQKCDIRIQEERGYA